MGYVESNLMEGERVILQTRIHGIVFLPPAVMILLGVGLFMIPVAGLLVLLVGVVMLAGAWIRHWTSEFAVTDRRVIIKVGLISRQTIEINMSKVESVEVRQGILARMLNYGTIVVIGTGGTKEPFDMIDDPLAFRRAVQSQQA
ncbi:MAG: PH domain-containing protein [Pseudomonadota bacterium]